MITLLELRRQFPTQRPPSRNEVAKFVGVSVNTWKKGEEGGTLDPDIKERIAKAFNLNITEIQW